MAQNAKNLLQEFCQKNKKKLPMYSTIQSMGSNGSGHRSAPNSSEFVSSVRLWDNSIFTGDPCSSKRKSEFDAAFKAYEALMKTAKKLTIMSQKSTLLLANFEKINCVNLVQNYNFEPSVTPLFFMTKNHPYSSQKDNRFLVIDSTVNDSVDVGITMTAVDLLLRNYTIYDKIVILSCGDIMRAFADLYIQRLIVNANSTELMWVTNIENLFELDGITVKQNS